MSLRIQDGDKLIKVTKVEVTETLPVQHVGKYQVIFTTENGKKFYLCRSCLERIDDNNTDAKDTR